MTELDSSDGSWLQTLSGGSYGFNHPAGIAFDGYHLWVANTAGNSVTELAANTGTWVQTISENPASYNLNSPLAIAFDGTHIWVVDQDWVTEINASNGSWAGTLVGEAYGFDGPNDIAFDGTHLWVTNSAGNSVTEIVGG